jgi:hypothetical protein
MGCVFYKSLIKASNYYLQKTLILYANLLTLDFILLSVFKSPDTYCSESKFCIQPKKVQLDFSQTP